MRQPRALQTIIYGGLVAAMLDITDACLFWWLARGVTPAAILRGIAAGLLGKAAYAGGLATAALGGVLHVLIACVMAAVYWLACLRLPALYRRPWFYGIAYGAVTFLVMDYIVLPLSAARPGTFWPIWFADDLLSHALLVGLPIALIARWSARTIDSNT
jgi:hypothetical protein